MRRRSRALLSLTAAAAIAGAVTARTISALISPYQGYSTSETFVQVEWGDSARLAARRLQQQGIVASAELFYLYLLLTGEAGAVKAGEYRFAGPVSLVDVVAKLTRGDIFFHRITVPEGLIFADIKPIFLQHGFGTDPDFDQSFRNVAAIRDLDPQAQDLEGYLFPETYLLSRDATAGSILDEMVKNFRESFDASRLQRAREMGMTVRQVVTMASLIEKETAVEGERFLVSSVYYNRLRRGMLLECDPTVIYAARRINRWEGVINRSDLKLDSPYNTYKYPGLPPGPIANPGLRSLDAALHPAETRYVYFVSRNDGTHVFNRDWAAHVRAAAQYRRETRANRTR